MFCYINRVNASRGHSHCWYGVGVTSMCTCAYNITWTLTAPSSSCVSHSECLLHNLSLVEQTVAAQISKASDSAGLHQGGVQLPPPGMYTHIEMSSLFQPWNSPGIGMVTTMPELLQPISWLLHACHGLKSNGRFNHVMVVSTKKHGCYHANSKVVSTKLVFFVWAIIIIYVHHNL